MKSHRRAVSVLVAGLTAAAVGGLPAVAQGSAQGDARDAAARCRTLATDAERLDCMERLVFDLAPPADAAETPAPAAAAASEAREAPAALEAPAAPAAASASAASEAEAAAEGRRRWLPRLPFTGQRDEVEPAVASAAVVEPASDSAQPARARDDERRQAEVVTARVVSFEEAVYQRLRVELDNGQVWEQRENVPPWREEQYGAPEEVEIFPSRFGGHRMRLVGKNLTLSVERVR